MKAIWLFPITLGLMCGMAMAQVAVTTPQNSAGSAVSSTINAGVADDDLGQLNSDVQRLKTLVNQMRTNMAFVQSSQTPLKQQFQLEADAWQVVIAQMERRIRRMEDKQRAAPSRP